MVHQDTHEQGIEAARRQLVEAETAFQRARSEDYVTRRIRDSAIVDAHLAGISSREISQLVGGIGQPNVVRTRRRATSRQEDLPDGLLSPADALRCSQLGPIDFITAVRSGRLRPVELPGNVRAFRPEDVERLVSET